jgi:hypothetical protein
VRLGRVDPSNYLRAFGLLARNPQIALAPLLAGVAIVLLTKVMPLAGDSALANLGSGSLIGLVSQLIEGYGLAVALIVAENAWRRGRAPFDDAWEEARRKAGDILLATIGFGFIVYVASVVGNFIPGGAYAMQLLATYFFIYTLPAAAIGGIPGGASLQVSFERARATPLGTAIVTIVYLFVNFIAPTLIVLALTPLALQIDSPYIGTIVSLVTVFVKAGLIGYVALVLAKAYDDASYGRY